jgi:hypothetical protein
MNEESRPARRLPDNNTAPSIANGAAELSGGWLYLVDERDDRAHVTHARRSCAAIEDGELRPVLVPFGTQPPNEAEWHRCELCGGARPVSGSL